MTKRPWVIYFPWRYLQGRDLSLNRKKLFSNSSHYLVCVFFSAVSVTSPYMLAQFCPFFEYAILKMHRFLSEETWEIQIFAFFYILVRRKWGRNLKPSLNNNITWQEILSPFGFESLQRPGKTFFKRRKFLSGSLMNEALTRKRRMMMSSARRLT